MTGADLFVSRLRAHGVEWAATLCGHGLDPLFDACRRAGLRLVDSRNEQAASYMADACARLTRQPGVAFSSSGVAQANALTGVVNAHFDGSPMLLVSGAAALDTMGKGHFQDLDQVALAQPVTKLSRLVESAESVPALVDEAFAAATAPRPGPVHLMFPMDVQRAEVRDARDMPVAAQRQAGAAGSAPDLPAAERPLLIAGSGVFYARQGEALAQFCERCAVPVATPIWDRGSIDQAIPQFMGVIGAATGGPRLLADADLILMCGAATDYRVGYLQPPAIRADARVVHIEPEDLNRLQLAPQPAWLTEAQRRRDEFRRAFESAARPNPGGIHALDIIAALREVLTGRTSLLIDGGSIGQWVHQLLCDRYPSHWLTCGVSGAVGWGLPGAMAMRMCYPDRPVILISGDGSMTFTVGELECAARQHLPFVTVVADDQAWGITRTGHQRQFGGPIASDLGPIDFAGLAEALGARGVRVGCAGEIAPAIRAALEADGPVVLHVPIRGGNDVPYFTS